MGDDVTLDDLLPVDFVPEEFPVPQMTCTRCGSLVRGDGGGESRADHERWHAAIESLTVSFRTEVSPDFFADTPQMIQVDARHRARVVERAGAAAPTQPEQPKAIHVPFADPTTGIEQCRAKLAAALGGAADDVTFDQLCEVIEILKRQEQRLRDDFRGISRGEVERLRRIEQALINVGAPNRSERGDPGGLVVHWIRQQAQLMKDQRAEIASLRNLPTDVAELQRQLRFRTAELEQARGQVDDYVKLEQELRHQLEARNADPLTAGADYTPMQEGTEPTPGQWIARFLSLSANERLQVVEQIYAQAGQAGACFRMNHEHQLAANRDYFNRLDALAARYGMPEDTVVLEWLEKQLIELAAHHGIQNGTHLCELNCTRDHPEGPISEQAISDLLLLAGVTVSPEQVATWTPEQREQATEWAGLTHLDASDNDVDVPKRPAFLDGPAGQVEAEPCPSLYLYRDGDTSTLLACRYARPHVDPDLHSDQVGTGPGSIIMWNNVDAVPSPWPVDQEPPAGINVLRDTSPTNPEPYLVRHNDDEWQWRTDPDKPSSNDPAAWVYMPDLAEGDLVVVRP